MEIKEINWFPGHMAKATKNIQDSLKNVDMIIEVVDARAIKASSNREFEILQKPRLKVALKTDLADVNTIKYEPNLIIGSTKELVFLKVIAYEVRRILLPIKQKKIAKGIVNPTFYIMVVGLPNVGKSSLINFLAGEKVVAVGNRPAVTKNQATIKITDNVYLQDNPGVFYKKVRSMEEGYILALLNTIKKEVLPLNDVVKFAYNYLVGTYPHLIFQRYCLPIDLSYEDFLLQYAKQRNFVTQGGKPDLNRAIETLFDDFANGAIGKVNYEK